MRHKLLVLSLVVLLACAFVFGFAFLAHSSPQWAPGYWGGKPQLAPATEGHKPQLAPASEGNQPVVS